MHTEVFNNIELLVEMSGSKKNMDEVNTELIDLQRTIKNKKNEIDELKSIMNNTRYFSASNELVDKNIEISLKNKIVRLEKRIKNLNAKRDEIKDKEVLMHDDITSLKNKLNKNEKYVMTLTNRSATEKNDFYKKLLKDENANVELLNSELNKKEKAYQELLKEMDLNNQAIDELNYKIEIEKERLKDITDGLNNPNTYIDNELKQKDEDTLAVKKEELEALEKRRIELLTDASSIAADAKQFIIDNNYNGALSKIKELVTIVKTKPYMDIASKNIIDEELEKKETERTELSNLIDNKNYEGIKSEAIASRINYLEKEIATNQDNIAKLDKEIHLIDEDISKNLANIIKNLEQEVHTKEGALEEYRTLINDKKTSSRAIANLENAITKKSKEKKILDGLLSSYKDDLLTKIERTIDLSNLSEQLKESIKKYELEIDNLNKLKLLDLNTKDLIEEEKDKEKLSTINKEIEALKRRKSYELSADEVYDQIEMLLNANINIEKEAKAVSLKEENPEIDNLFENKIKVVEMIPVETVTTPNAGGDSHGA